MRGEEGYPALMDSGPPALTGCTPWFLTTPPPRSGETIARPRLHDRITHATSTEGLAVVAAPPGFGKTVLLNSWAIGHQGTSAWLTLTRHEADDEHLLVAGILSALERISVGESGGKCAIPTAAVGRRADPRELLGRIADVVALLPEPVVLVIDDAHYAGSVLGHHIVDVLLALTGGRLGFIIAGNPEILRWFTRRITSRPRIVLTAAELAMTTDEVVLDAANRGQELDPAQAEARRATTGGWPIALHLTDLASLSCPSDHHWRASLVVDFIEGDILPSLPARLKDFVLAATTTARLDAGVAQTLSGDPEAESLLEHCLSAGLFIERLTDGSHRSVYQWHDVFSEACRRVVSRASSRRSRELDATAARALATGYPAEALVHSVRAGDTVLTVEILRSAWLRILIEGGARPLLHIFRDLPEELTMNPEVRLIRACCLDLLGDHSGARMLAPMSTSTPDDDPDLRLTRSFAQLVLVDDPAELLRSVDRAQQELVANGADQVSHGYRVFLLGWTLLRLRENPGRAAALLRTAVDEARRSGRPILEQRAGSNLLFALAYAGRFADAHSVVVVDGAEVDHGDDAWGRYDDGIRLFALGFSAFWTGRLDDATDRLRALLDTQGHDESYTALGRVFLALTAAARGDERTIRDAHTQVDRIGRAERHGVPWHVYRAVARAALLVAAGQTRQALGKITPLRDERNVPVVRVISADIARRCGEPALAEAFLRGLRDRDWEVSYIGVSAYTTIALLAYGRGDHVEAHRAIELALQIAVREDVVSPLARTEPQLRELLSAHARAGSRHREFIAARLAELETLGMVTPALSALSGREREVLAYLRTPMTSGEIAVALFVSVNTVRTHQRAIYRKLGVTNRRDAVANTFASRMPTPSPKRVRSLSGR